MPRNQRHNLPVKPVRQNLYLVNHQLLKKMAVGVNLSWFVDELIAREGQRRAKRDSAKLEEKSLA